MLLQEHHRIRLSPINPSASEIRPTGLTLQQPTGIMLQPPIFLPPVTSQPIPLYGVNSTRTPTQSITFPKPATGQFLIHSLKFCPSQTSKCFVCGNFLKQKDSIPEAPLDLVIVSKMMREWTYLGSSQCELRNVYFHCNNACVKRKEPNFDGRLCIVLPELEPYLQSSHKQYLMDNVGLHCY